MTELQRAVLQFVREAQAQGRSPSHREIAKRFGWRSPFSAKAKLNALERQGLVRVDPSKSRAVQIVAGQGGIPVLGVVQADGRISAAAARNAALAFPAGGAS